MTGDSPNTEQIQKTENLSPISLPEKNDTVPNTSLSSVMRWGFRVIIKLTVFEVILGMTVFSIMLVHWSINREASIRDIGEFAYNYLFGFAVLTTGLIASAGGAKAVQSFSENRPGGLNGVNRN